MNIKNFLKPKVIIPTAIIAIAIIISGVMIFVFMGLNRNKSTTSGNTANNINTTGSVRGARQRRPGNFDISQVCNNQNSFPQPRQGQSNDSVFSQIQAKIKEYCADGTLTDTEKQDLQNLFDQLRQQRQNNFNQNGNNFDPNQAPPDQNMN